MAKAIDTQTGIEHALPSGATTAKLAKRTMDGERLISIFTELVEPLGRSLPLTSEVVLHDLSLLPNSIIAVFGDVTGRRPGDPATDLLLQRVASGNLEEHSVGYETALADGRKLRSTTMIIRDVSGVPVAALCINSDMSDWQSIMRIAQAMTGNRPPADEVDDAPSHPVPGEMFPKDVDELAVHLISKSIAEVGVEVNLMKKEHKVEVVRRLKSHGLFMIREGVEMAASSLNVTRFTIYNYLNEISDDDGTETPHE